MLLSLRAHLSFVFLALDFAVRSLFQTDKVLLLLPLVQGGPLFLNHVSMGEREVGDLFAGLQIGFEVLLLRLFVLEQLVGHDKGVDFVSLVILLKLPLLLHERALELKMLLLILSFTDLLVQVSIALFMYLVNESPKQVFLLHLEDNAFVEPVAHASVDEVRHERVRYVSFWHASRPREVHR